MLQLGASLGIHTVQLAPPGTTCRAALIDVHGDARRLYGMRGECLILIRPDGYAGLISRPIRMRAVLDYLARLWPAAPRHAAALDPHASTQQKEGRFRTH